jgi:hypothetical protein
MNTVRRTTSPPVTDTRLGRRVRRAVVVGSTLAAAGTTWVNGDPAVPTAALVVLPIASMHLSVVAA